MTDRDLSLDNIKSIKVTFIDEDKLPTIYSGAGLNVFKREFLANNDSQKCSVPSNSIDLKYKTSSLQYEPDTSNVSIFERAKRMQQQSGINFD